MASRQACTLATKVPITPGGNVIVTDGTSSVGAVLILIAHDLGATVIATTRTAASKPEILALAADYAIATDYVGLAGDEMSPPVDTATGRCPALAKSSKPRSVD